MPYVKPEPNREQLDPGIELLGGRIESVGDLNYAITRLTLQLLIKRGISYENLNNTLGTPLFAFMEMYRRVGVPYENPKMAANGDVPEIIELLELIQDQNAQENKNVSSETDTQTALLCDEPESTSGLP